MFNLLQPIVEFYNNNKDFINNLLSGALPAIVGFFWWLKWRHRQRRIPDKTFAFEVITPKSQDLMQRILGGEDNDPLADRNIVYQERVANRYIRNELKRQLEEHRWILILGRTGLGKTQEAAELAKHLNQESWTVLYLKLGEWLDIPAAMPREIGTNRKFDKALEIKPDYHEAWYNRGNALKNLGRLEKAIASYDQALKIKPDDHDAWYNKACCYSLLGNIDLAIDNLQQAINLNPECREIAKTDPNFGNIREDQQFQDLISH
ncbi:tetratricopeptide repeat protein [uncultured Nostoc sp.]|uniref:tetratricopeptide repeat protein n=1 Tax=uncultured Nostoc sp. TaxID=340711 RepID=UPI0035CB4F26